MVSGSAQGACRFNAFWAFAERKAQLCAGFARQK
jgi:hypothetical protein